jgi:hypothetical protein
MDTKQMEEVLKRGPNTRDGYSYLKDGSIPELHLSQDWHMCGA